MKNIKLDCGTDCMRCMITALHIQYSREGKRIVEEYSRDEKMKEVAC